MALGGSSGSVLIMAKLQKARQAGGLGQQIRGNMVMPWDDNLTTVLFTCFSQGSKRQKYSFF